MKKFLVSLLLMLPLCGFAQKGMQGVGVHLGFGDFKGSYQKSLSDKLKMDFSLSLSKYAYCEYTLLDEISYDSYNCIEHAISYLIGSDLHYFLTDVRRLRPYVAGGVYLGFFTPLGIAFENEYGFIETKSDPGIAGGIKLGIGLSYRIGYNWATQLELPICIGAPIVGLCPTLGLVYNF